MLEGPSLASMGRDPQRPLPCGFPRLNTCSNITRYMLHSAHYVNQQAKNVCAVGALPACLFCLLFEWMKERH